MKHSFAITGIALATVFTSCTADVKQKNHYFSKIDSLVKVQNPRTFNGVVFIQQNGEKKYEKAYGYVDFNKKTPLKITDRFSTMSIAKQITATLILQEVEKGTIDLHKPIRQYLPDFKYAWADTVTVHHLLNHTSGLYSDELKSQLKFKTGTAFGYSNVGYSVAGMVLEKQSGKTFNALVTALFKKCTMNDSSYPTETSSQLLTKGHTIRKDGSFEVNDRSDFVADNYFGSHLIVTAPDLAKWNESLHNGQLLKPETYKLMTGYSVTDTHQVFSEKPIGYGYGLRINDKADIYEIGHTGFHPSEGFTAVNLYYPKTKTSVIIMENVANENFDIAYYFEQEVRKIVMDSQLLK
jgi:D-alanyl-D-alanine carboxypeptidase